MLNYLCLYIAYDKMIALLRCLCNKYNFHVVRVQIVMDVSRHAIHFTVSFRGKSILKMQKGETSLWENTKKLQIIPKVSLPSHHKHGQCANLGLMMAFLSGFGKLET